MVVAIILHSEYVFISLVIYERDFKNPDYYIMIYTYSIYAYLVGRAGSKKRYV